MKIFLLILLILLILVLVIVLWVLIAQVIITIDSRKQIYELRLATIGKASLQWEDQLPCIDTQILFWRKRIKYNPFTNKTAPSQKEKFEKKEKKRKEKRRTASEWKEKSIRVLRSFRLEIFRFNLDTDSYYYNSLLYPLFFFANRKNFCMNINYQGNTDLKLVLKNRPIKILYALYF